MNKGTFFVCKTSFCVLQVENIDHDFSTMQESFEQM